MLALEIEAHNHGYLSEIGPKLTARFMAQDLLLRTLGNTVYVMPNYCIEPNDLTALHIAIAEAVQAM